MAGGALAWATAQPTVGVTEETKSRELQPGPVNVSACENAGAGTRMKEL